MKNSISQNEEMSCENIINTPVYEDIRRPFAENDKTYPEKHCVSQSNVMRFRDIGKSNFCIGEQHFRTSKNDSKTIITTIVYE